MSYIRHHNNIYKYTVVFGDFTGLSKKKKKQLAVDSVFQ